MDQAFRGNLEKEERTLHDSDSHTTAGVGGFVQVDYH